MQTQHDENTKLSSSNSRLTILTIILAVVFGIPNIVDMFQKDNSKDMLIEQKEQNELMQVQISEFNNISKEMDSFHALIQNNQEKTNNTKVTKK